MTAAVPRPASDPGPAAVAERLLARALGEVRDSIDAIPTVSAALAALRIEAGELAPDGLAELAELAGILPAAVTCVCPADLLGRGGFRGSCPAPEHRTAGTAGQR